MQGEGPLSREEEPQRVERIVITSEKLDALSTYRYKVARETERERE